MRTNYNPHRHKKDPLVFSKQTNLFIQKEINFHIKKQTHTPRIANS